jgi:hypothetical protein
MGWWDTKEVKESPSKRVSEDEMQPLVLSKEQKGKMAQEKKLLVLYNVIKHVSWIRIKWTSCCKLACTDISKASEM